jgi:8-oxo-dGTP diphosphatase / 2-hydroxy-dATP diphosphatase
VFDIVGAIFLIQNQQQEATMVLPPLPRKLLTLAFVVRNFPLQNSAVGAVAPPSTSTPQVLLGLKKRGFGMGKWNGFGGKVDASDASIVAAAAREVREEANIVVNEADLQERGTLMFTFEGGKEILVRLIGFSMINEIGSSRNNCVDMQEVHVFFTDKFTGEPSESDEMRPQWYDADAIPFDAMWQDDRIWLPHVLSGKAVYGLFHFAKDEDTMLHHELEVMEPEIVPIDI